MTGMMVRILLDSVVTANDVPACAWNQIDIKQILKLIITRREKEKEIKPSGALYRRLSH
jgi:hypothetical protein